MQLKIQIQLRRFLEIDRFRVAVEHIVPHHVAVTDPVIFLHDSLGCISVWKDFPGLVAQATKRTCIVYDRQGYGASDPFSNPVRNNGYLEEQAGFLIKLLDALNISTCILFGHSDGGSIALIAAAKYPERIKAVITEGAHVFVEEITLQGIRQAVELYKTTDLKARLEKHHGTKVDALFRAWTDTWLSPEFRNWNIEYFLPQITCPVLIIQGEKDEYGSPLQVDAIYKGICGAKEKRLIPDIGHTPHKEAKDITLREVSAFMQSMAPGH